MACVWKHDSLKSPYWIARFTNHEGKRVNRSTKLSNRQKAQALADRWEAAAKLAGRRELVQAAAVRVLDEMMVATNTRDHFAITNSRICPLYFMVISYDYRKRGQI